MPKFPEPPPPAVLANFAPRLHVLPAGTALWRIYFRGGEHALGWRNFRTFGPLRTSRFDHHLPAQSRQERGLLYAATDVLTCVAEVYQETRVLDTRDRDPWLVGFETGGKLALLGLTGTWPTAAGASMAINSGSRARARRWSQAIYAAYPSLHGLWYCASMNANKPAVTLYERAEGMLADAPFFHRALADPVLLTSLRSAAHELGYRLV